MGCLYKLTSPSGKSYIGITKKSLDARWAKHVEHACGKRTAGAIYAALRKYGPETFTKEVLAENDDWAELRRMERAAIIGYQTFPPNGYNISSGAEGPNQRVFSESARRNISVAQKRRYQDPIQRQQLLMAGIAGRAKTSAAATLHRAKAKAERAAYAMSAECKESHAAATRAALARPEVRAKIMAAAATRSASPVWRERVSQSKTGVKLGPCSEERKAKIRAARLREWSDPGIREKRLAACAIARAAKASQSSKRDGAWNWLPLNPPKKDGQETR